MKISSLRKRVDAEMTRRDILCESLLKLRSNKLEAEENYQAALKAREILRAAAQETQSSIEDNIGSIVSLALNAVFDEPYRFKVEFVRRRNKIECDLFLESGGERVRPFDSVGGGVLDVISFALRTAIVLMGGYRKVLILDEPMRFLSRNYQPKAAEMFAMISRKIKLQVIMATHIPELIETADVNFQIR